MHRITICTTHKIKNLVFSLEVVQFLCYSALLTIDSQCIQVSICRRLKCMFMLVWLAVLFLFLQMVQKLNNAHTNMQTP